MACFIVPLTEAAVVSAVRRSKMKSDQKKSKSPWLTQLPKLEWMLWGGSLMLVADHLISGELMFRFPFFSALALEGGVATMLREMLTVGLPMSALITLVYVGMAFYEARNKGDIQAV